MNNLTEFSSDGYAMFHCNFPHCGGHVRIQDMAFDTDAPIATKPTLVIGLVCSSNMDHRWHLEFANAADGLQLHLIQLRLFAPLNPTEIEEVRLLEVKWGKLINGEGEMSPAEMNRYASLTDRYRSHVEGQPHDHSS